MTRKRSALPFAVAFMAAIAAAPLTGCEDEEVIEDDIGEETGEMFEEGTDAVGEAADETGEAVEDATNQ